MPWSRFSLPAWTPGVHYILLTPQVVVKRLLWILRVLAGSLVNCLLDAPVPDGVPEMSKKLCGIDILNRRTQLAAPKYLVSRFPT